MNAQHIKQHLKYLGFSSRISYWMPPLSAEAKVSKRSLKLCKRQLKGFKTILPKYTFISWMIGTESNMSVSSLPYTCSWVENCRLHTIHIIFILFKLFSQPSAAPYGWAVSLEETTTDMMKMFHHRINTITLLLRGQVEPNHVSITEDQTHGRGYGLWNSLFLVFCVQPQSLQTKTNCLYFIVRFWWQLHLTVINGSKFSLWVPVYAASQRKKYIFSVLWIW